MARKGMPWSFPANGYGLHVMAGNGWQWTTDWYQEHSKIDFASPSTTREPPNARTA